MKKKPAFLLMAALLLAGCSAPEAAPEPTVPAEIRTEIIQTAPPPTEAPPEPAEPELPWPADVRWYGTYYFEERPNPDPNIVTGVVRFNARLRNDDRTPLTIVSAHADFYLGTEVISREDFDSARLPDFLPHPRSTDLTMDYGESRVLQLYSTEQEKGTYDRAVVTYTLSDSEGNTREETFYFAVNQEDITPYSFSDRDDWSAVTRTEERWNFHFLPQNTTDRTIEFVGIYDTSFLNGLPMGFDFFDKSTVSPQALKAIRTMRPGQLSYYQSGITHRFNRSDEREFTMVFKNETGELFLQTFHFALDEAYSIPEVFNVMQLIGEKKNLVFLDSPEKIQQELGTSQYTRQEIRQMIDDGLTLEELAEKLTNVYEVQQFFLEAGILFTGTDIKQHINGTLWHFSDSPAVVLRKNTGTCGSGSGLINYLLHGDYDEQGYFSYAANRSGHIFNYFRSGEKYYIWDWNWRRDDWFDLYRADSLEDFTDAYISMNQTTEEPAGMHRILLLYAYPYEGNVLPLGDGATTALGAPAMHKISNEIEDTVRILYVDSERYAPVFVECPPADQWPKDAQ